MIFAPKVEPRPGAAGTRRVRFYILRPRANFRKLVLGEKLTFSPKSKKFRHLQSLNFSLPQTHCSNFFYAGASSPPIIPFFTEIRVSEILKFGVVNDCITWKARRHFARFNLRFELTYHRVQNCAQVGRGGRNEKAYRKWNLSFLRFRQTFEFLDFGHKSQHHTYLLN